MDAGAVKLVLDCLGAGVVVADRTGRVIYANDEAVRLVGVGVIDEPPSRWPEAYGLLLPDETTPFPADDVPLARALRGESTDGVAIFVRNIHLPAGRHLSVSGRPCGAPLGGAIVFHDIDDRVRAAEEQRKARIFLDSIVENVPLMIFVKEARELRFERFNRAGEELLGIPREDLIDKNDHDFFPKEQADFFTARDRQTLEAKALVEIPEEPIDTARGRRWLYTRKVPIVGEKGEPAYLLGISLDITERKEAEDGLQRAHAELEQRVLERTAELERTNAELREQIAERQKAEEALRASEEQLRHAQKIEAVGRLAGGVAHDFNNLLAVILGLSSVLCARAREESRERQDLEQITAAAKRATGLTRQLLAFSSQQVLQPRLLDLCGVVREMETMLRPLVGEHIELRTVYALEPAPVFADESHLEQVIINLVVNARDAMKDGGRLTITVQHAELDDGGPLPRGSYVRLSIGDTGVGMSAETIARAFEPFFTTKARGKGTGLGLPTAFGIVKQSGGHIGIKSELGCGSCFEILLPRAQGEIAAQPARRARSERPPGAETVLLVEDDDQVRGAILTMLREEGYRVVTARSGAEALSICKSHVEPIHLLLTDVVMPVMSGAELAKSAGEIRPRMRVLFMSGHPDDAIARHGVLAPGIELIAKPFTPEALARRIRDVLEPDPIAAH